MLSALSCMGLADVGALTAMYSNNRMLDQQWLGRKRFHSSLC